MIGARGLHIHKNAYLKELVYKEGKGIDRNKCKSIESHFWAIPKKSRFLKNSVIFVWFLGKGAKNFQYQHTHNLCVKHNFYA